jgi:1-acyl-sn-glycerol-3-phosphate acyltransferase
VPFGSIGLSLFAVDLYFAQPGASISAVVGVEQFLDRAGSSRILFDMAMLGAFGGFYSVPLYAMVQERADRQYMSRIIAANNILNALFMVAAAGVAITTLKIGLSIPQLFLVLALLNALVAAYIYSLLPEFLMRFVVWILVNILYRIHTSGRENIPQKGAAVVVCNHVGYIDPLILGGSIRRPVRFVMYYKIFEIPMLNFLFRTAKAIPIASAKEDEGLLQQAFDKIDQELAKGNLVCVYPEGAITGDGNIQEFRGGVEKIIARRPVPVIPVAVSGLWGSWFSRKTGGGLQRIPGRLFARVDVRIGEAIPPGQVTAKGLQMLVRTLRGDKR